jgi:MFS transporter, MFS domain-containing protein family, molybdate-anion transporter
MSFYDVYMWGLLAVFVASLLYKRDMFKFSSGAAGGSAFASFQWNFLAVYLIMMAADWMQGPYVYRLYAHYGFSRAENGQLFIAGFGSSLVFGTWSGPLADRYGRKLACILYGITYILSCATKHFPNFTILLIGRVFGGIATSLLWSAFESWMVSEHLSRGFDPALIGNTFSMMITLNGLVAIGSGFVSQWAADLFDHPVAPFDASALCLAVGTVLVWFTWKENFGEQRHDMVMQMREGINKVAKDPRIVFTGLQQSLFEGAMYTFVFMWTPTLEDETPGAPSIPYGLIFACFMIASSLGGSLFGLATSFTGGVQGLMRYLYMAAAAMMAVPVISDNKALIMGGFLVFEVVVGMFWPGIGTLRSQYIPEESRATITNLFRVPLNTIVCLVLYYQGAMTVSTVFTICTVFHAGAVVSAIWLEMSIARAQASEKDVTG